MREIKGVRYSDDLKTVIGYNLKAISPHVVILPTAREIADEAFKNLSSLEIINLSKVKKIGAYSFANCRSLSRVESTQNLISVGHCSFCRCESLRHIELHNGLEEISDGAFLYTGVKVLDLPSTVVLGNEDMHHSVAPDFNSTGHVGLETVIMNAEQYGDGNAFVDPYPYIIFKDANGEDTGKGVWTEDGAVYTVNEKEQIELLRLPHDRDIPYGTEALGAYCISISGNSIYLPDTIEEINEDAFSMCYRLKNFFVSKSSFKRLEPIIKEINENFNVLVADDDYSVLEDINPLFESVYLKKSHRRFRSVGFYSSEDESQQELCSYRMYAQLSSRRNRSSRYDHSVARCKQYCSPAQAGIQYHYS